MNRETLNGLIEQSVKENWSAPAFSNYEGQTYTFSQVAEEIVSLHTLFRNLGVEQGDRIALLGRNQSNWALVYLATISYGAVIVPILPDFSESDIRFILKHSGSDLLFVSQAMLVKGVDMLDEISSVFELGSFEALKQPNIIQKQKSEPLKNKELFSLSAIQENEPAVISYTSGTSGNSKGVVLSHKNIWSNAHFGFDAKLDLGNGDRVVSFLPLAHAYGCLFEFLAPFVMGCHITFLSKVPSPKVIIKAFSDVKPKLILAVPLIIEKIYKNKILPVLKKPIIRLLLRVPGLRGIVHRSVRAKLTALFGEKFIEIIIGGAPLNKEVEQFLLKIGFRFTIGYGMTECGPLISYTGWGNHIQGSAGTIVSRMECRIESDNPAAIPGEIQVRGDNVMLGYYKNESATKASLTHDGWLKTGDLGILSSDGRLSIKGRSKSLILSGNGQNIYPEEVEAYVHNLPYVSECLVRGREGKLEALIYPDMDKMELDGVQLKQVEKLLKSKKRVLNKQLPPYCNVAFITLVDEEFKKTPKKSIKRYLYELKE